jgi:hypothetical protein
MLLCGTGHGSQNSTGSQVVSNGKGVQVVNSELPTSAMSITAAQPQCEYTVRRDSPNGPVVNFANVGDQVRSVSVTRTRLCTGVSCVAMFGQC